MLARYDQMFLLVLVLVCFWCRTDQEHAEKFMERALRWLSNVLAGFIGTQIHSFRGIHQMLDINYLVVQCMPLPCPLH